ncbi:MAG: hypothetical protein EOO88_62020, partial [Pedobacter sp.]
MWMPEYLGKEGNKLLKVIEEPPPNTLFILVAESEEQILQTILSRTQLVKVPLLLTEEIEQSLIERNSTPVEQARQVAGISEGNYHEALQLLQHAEEDWQGILRDWLNATLKAGPAAQVKWVDEIAKILSRYQDKKSIKFAWPLLKDRLENCQCIISGSSIEIEPYVAPLDMFGSYWKAHQRIFMSATVTDDAFLIKGLRLAPNTIVSPLTYAKEKWSGEKMILIPSLMDDSLDRGTIVKFFGNAWPKSDFGRVALVNSFNNSKDWSAYGANIAETDTIQSKLLELKNKSYEKALVLVNRYDGIDLPDNDCRILVFDGKPYSQNLVDLYEEDCRPDAESTMMRA